MRRFVRLTRGVLCGFVAVICLRADTLKEVLDRMDRSAETFQGMTANLTQLQHTAIINEDDRDSATVRMKKTKEGLRGFVEFAEPNRRLIGFENRELQVYYPKTNTVNIYDLGKHGAQLDQFLLLGFGTSGKQLEKTYNMRVTGAETLNGNPVTHVELLPKTAEVKEYLKKVELWIPSSASYPVQEKIDKNDQDYILIQYSDVKINPGLTDKDLALSLPAGVNKVYPQK
jgi:outer membrane lipoprotein-sorting protein